MPLASVGSRGGRQPGHATSDAGAVPTRGWRGPTVARLARKKTPGQGPGVFLLPGVGRVVNDQRSALPVVGTVPVIGKPFWSTAATVAEPARGV